MDTFNLITTQPLQVYLKSYLYQNAPHSEVKHTYRMYPFCGVCSVVLPAETLHRKPTKIIKPVMEFLYTKRTL